MSILKAARSGQVVTTMIKTKKNQNMIVNVAHKKQKSNHIHVVKKSDLIENHITKIILVMTYYDDTQVRIYDIEDWDTHYNSLNDISLKDSRRS